MADARRPRAAGQARARGWACARAAELAAALGWLTRLPLPGAWAGRGGGVTLGRAVWAFAPVGLVVGALGGGVLALGLALGLPVAPAALLALGAAIAATGALHEDGLADYADGCGATTPEAALRIMRDSRIGSYGVLALGLSGGLRASCLAALAAALGGWGAALAMCAAGALSRAGMAVALAALPPARPDGLGRAAGRPTGRGAAVAAGLGLLAAAGACLAAGLGPMAWAVMAGACALAQAGLARQARRRLGGQTGDVLGAIQQAGEVAALLALAALA